MTAAVPRLLRLLAVLPGLFLVPCSGAAGDTLYVAPSGNDTNPGTALLPWRTIQHACTSAGAGSVVLVRGGLYREKVVMTSTGLPGAPVRVRPEGPDSVILDGTGVSGQHMLLLHNPRHVELRGLVLRNNSGITDGGGVRIEGAGEGVLLGGLLVEHMRGSNAMGITVYGTHPSLPLRDIRIVGNTVRRCEPAPSEAITLNGNVEDFLVEGNVVEDVDNIGIDCIGGEGMCPTPALDRARRGVVRGNRISRARSSYGGGYAAGIYIDGGSAILVELNLVTQSDMGIEVGCENRGTVAESITVRNNVLFGNDKAGLAVGGYDYPRTGQVRACEFLHNTLFRNDLLATGDGEIRVEYARACRFRNNVVHAGPAGVLLTAATGTAEGNAFDFNVWFAPGGPAAAAFTWSGASFTGWAAFRSGSGQEPGGRFDDPRFANDSLPFPDLHIRPGSPAEDAGDPGFVAPEGTLDIDGEPRVIGARTDAGADESGLPPPAPGLVSPAQGAPDLPPVAVLHWGAVPRAEMYVVEAGADSGFAPPFMRDTVREGTSGVTPLLRPDTNVFWRVRARNSAGEGPWSGVRYFRVRPYAPGMVRTVPGWNLLALPVTPFESAPALLFPRAVSHAFGFGTAGYTRLPTIAPGTGWWMKFSAEEEAIVPGLWWNAETLSVAPGWNLLGGGRDSLEVSSLLQIPAGILLSGFISFEGSYMPAERLLPGRGYWVKSAAQGLLVRPFRRK